MELIDMAIRVDEANLLILEVNQSAGSSLELMRHADASASLAVDGATERAAAYGATFERHAQFAVSDDKSVYLLNPDTGMASVVTGEGDNWDFETAQFEDCPEGLALVNALYGYIMGGRIDWDALYKCELIGYINGGDLERIKAIYLDLLI